MERVALLSEIEANRRVSSDGIIVHEVFTCCRTLDDILVVIRNQVFSVFRSQRPSQSVKLTWSILISCDETKLQRFQAKSASIFMDLIVNKLILINTFSDGL